jgi:hypothetical protein
MGVQIGQWTLDVYDVDAMACFWAAALGYRIDEMASISAHRPVQAPAH